METPKINKLKIIGLVVFVVVGVLFITNSTKLLKKPSRTFVVEKGTISLEESVTGYIIRDETVLQENESGSEMVQIKYEKEKVAKGDSVFRYYSKKEDKLIGNISELDEQINQALAENESIIVSSDMISVEKQIEDTLNSMYNTNELRKLDEYIKKIENYITKKAQIAGEHSPTGSLVKNLIQKRTELENELNSSSELINSPISGVVSYRVDGLEEHLKVGDFSYLNKDTLRSYDLKVGAIVPQSKKVGKVVNNFVCYIAVAADSEKAEGAKVGDKIILRLSNSKEVESSIVYILEEDDGSRILVFEIKDGIEELIEYRKISLDIIWWKFSGFKISNSAITVDENDLAYIERSKAGYTEKILVKILRQNETFSIVNNYTEEELKELGFSDDDISSRNILKLHDEIMLH